MTKIKTYFYYHLPWQLLMIFIFIQSSISNIKIPDFDFNLFDKIIHFLIYGILAFLMARSFRIIKNKKLNDCYIMFSTVICILYGASDEFHQSLVQGRFASIYDWLADVIGVIFGVTIYFLIIKKSLNDGT